MEESNKLRTTNIDHMAGNIQNYLTINESYGQYSAVYHVIILYILYYTVLYYIIYII